MDEQISAPPPQKPFPFLPVILFILTLLSLASTVYLGYQNIQLRKQITILQLMPTPTPPPPADPTASWKLLNMKGCSTRNKDIMYSIKTPDDWTVSKAKEDSGRTVYNLSSGSNADIVIDCDTVGIGSVICVNGGSIDHPFQINSSTQDGCFWTADPNTQSYGAEYTVKNPFGSFVFYVRGVEKSLLDQILSTFRFVDQEPASACTMEAKLCPDGSAVGRTGPNCEFSPCPTD